MKYMKKIYINVIFILVGLFLFTNMAQAHVVVRPSAAGIGTFQTFTVSVPAEKDLTAINIRLMLPDGLESVTPTVKPGWKVEVKKHDLPSGTHPYEIEWSKGNIPGHYRDDFTFSAKVPVTPTTLLWKAYQTYSDGSVVAWDLSPTDEQPKKDDGTPDFSKFGPYSQTQIVDDLVGKPDLFKNLSLPLSVVALLISIATAVVVLRNNRSRSR